MCGFAVSVPFGIKFNLRHDRRAKKDRNVLIRWFKTQPNLLMVFQTVATGGVDEETGEVRGGGDTVCMYSKRCVVVLQREKGAWTCEMGGGGVPGRALNLPPSSRHLCMYSRPAAIFRCARNKS